MQRNDRLVRKLQSAIAYLETFQEMYQDKEAPLELVQPLQAVLGMLREIRREIVLQELAAVLRSETRLTAIQKRKVIKIFQLLA